jgi:hydrolase
MKKVIYVHGKGGNAAEAEHFGKLFADCEVVGFDYKSQSPQEARDEFPPFSLTKKQPLAQ